MAFLGEGWEKEKRATSKRRRSAMGPGRGDHRWARRDRGGDPRSERTEERWPIGELLRVKGELILLQDAPEAATAAGGHLRQALDRAHQQGALSWELRAATSLARLLRDQNRPTEAIALLPPIYNRFTEGFETADLRVAKALIDGFYNGKGAGRLLMDAPRGGAASTGMMAA
jgi:hypothetical protein